MSDVIGPAPTSRAKCRGCGGAIAQGELRFGESEANTYGEGESYRWFHLRCAALRRPERLGPALETASDVENRDELQALVAEGLEHPRLTRLAGSERAASGRAHCRHCRELIEKGALRIALEIWEEGRFSPMGFLHVRCAKAYFETDRIEPRLRAVPSKLGDSELAEAVREIEAGPTAAEFPAAGDRRAD